MASFLYLTDLNICRRNNGRTVTVKCHGQDIELDNRWVAPYNPCLTLLFDCHINVEVVSSIKAVKYLYKYVYKGHDRTQIRIERNLPNSEGRQPPDGPVEHDEIADYLDARCVPMPTDVAWLLFNVSLLPSKL